MLLQIDILATLCGTAGSGLPTITFRFIVYQYNFALALFMLILGIRLALG